ncbi:hypothetical protein DFH08DRAFT_897928 [Mycena albidolilacea]|uniref:DUF6534 domain-containing protein n=1 Tax=Mycena albidolilacea TaxID=1033008 RepID=A0AAD6Z7Q8_9AGAR|nr:hypothetical protein DFH08DRAFT_897928 [Mycena albidolilacea]
MTDQTDPFAAFAGLTLSFLEDSLGVYYIGYVFASVGFGFTFFQSYLYYTRYPNDIWLIQATVVILCGLDTAMSALSSHALYYYLVTLLSLPVGPDNATTSFCVEVLLSGIAIAIVQGFYAMRIWQVSQSAVLPAVIIVLSIAGAGLGIATGTVMLHDTLFANFSTQHMKAVISTGQGLRLLAALLTAGGFVMFGVKLESSEKPSVWDKASDFLTSGTAGALAQLLCFLTFIAMPKKYVWIIFHFISSRVFINGLLLMLNSRKISRGRGINGEETRSQPASRGTGTLYTNTTTSDITFNNNRTTNHPVKIEVSRAVDSDMDAAKDPDDFDAHSMGSHKVLSL